MKTPQHKSASRCATRGSYGYNYWEVFARGSDSALYEKDHRNTDGFGGGPFWTNWPSLSGILTSAPTAISWASGATEVFVRNTNNTISHRGSLLTGPDWVTESGIPITENLAAACWTSGLVDLFSRASDGTLLHRVYTGPNRGDTLTLTSDWTNLGAGSVENYAVAGW